MPPEHPRGRELLRPAIMRPMPGAPSTAAAGGTGAGAGASASDRAGARAGDGARARAGAGQSPGPPLWRKLGVREGAVVSVLEAPEGFDLGEMPAGVTVRRSGRGRADLTVWFVRSRARLDRRMASVAPRGANSGLWIAWPKRTSPLAVDLSDEVVRRTAIAHGLVDFKVCAIDSDWSGLRFNKRKEAT
jgi:hypothetical protein